MKTEREMKIYGEGGDPRLVPPSDLEHTLLVSSVRHTPGRDNTGDLYEDDPRLKASEAQKREIRRHESRQNGGDNK